MDLFHLYVKSFLKPGKDGLTSIDHRLTEFTRLGCLGKACTCGKTKLQFLNHILVLDILQKLSFSLLIGSPLVRSKAIGALVRLLLKVWVPWEVLS